MCTHALSEAARESREHMRMNGNVSINGFAV